MRELLLVLCVCLVACAGRGRPRTELLGPPTLVGWVPASAALVVVARPRELFRHESASHLLRSLVSEPDERALRERTGVDLRSLREVVWAELGHERYLLLLRGPVDAERVVAKAAARLVAVDTSVDAPVFRREGVSAAARYAYAALGPHTVLVAKDVPKAAYEAVLARRHAPAPHALSGEAARSLVREHEKSPLVAYLPQPLALPRHASAGVLLARERSMALALEPRAEAVRLTVAMRGEFPPAARTPFRALVTYLSESPLGRLLGLAQPLSPPRISASRERLQASALLSGARLGAGVHRLFQPDLRQLF